MSRQSGREHIIINEMYDCVDPCVKTRGSIIDVAACIIARNAPYLSHRGSRNASSDMVATVGVIILLDNILG